MATAAELSEVLDAIGKEIDRVNAIWTIPANRMKAGKEHRVPLSAEALALLPNKIADNSPLFLGPKGKPMSNMALLMMLRRMKRSALT